jgi:uncharacterized protein YdcH (DUF465 family)
MRKNFNAQKYNARMDKIFEEVKRLNKLRDRINPLKIAISNLSNWELKELKEFIDNELELSNTCIIEGLEKEK